MPTSAIIHPPFDMSNRRDFLQIAGGAFRDPTYALERHFGAASTPLSVQPGQLETLKVVETIKEGVSVYRMA